MIYYIPVTDVSYIGVVITVDKYINKPIATLPCVIKQLLAVNILIINVNIS